MTDLSLFSGVAPSGNSLNQLVNGLNGALQRITSLENNPTSTFETLTVTGAATFGDTVGITGAATFAAGANFNSGSFVVSADGTEVTFFSATMTVTEENVTVGQALGVFNDAFFGSVATSYAAGLTAAGTDRATAFAVTADINTFSTVASNTGALIPQALSDSGRNARCMLQIINNGANSLQVYSQSQIDGGSGEVGVAIPAGVRALFTSTDDGKWTSAVILSLSQANALLALLL